MLLPLLLMICAASAFELPPMFLGRHRNGLVYREKRAMYHNKTSNGADERLCVQPLDHFNAHIPDKLYQRYFVNDQYGDSDFRFLYIGGETTLSGDVITGDDLPIVEYAKRFKATLYALEHRFYGQSHFDAPYTIGILEFLSTKQALEDIAGFIKNINRDFKTPQKWICFGGSYGGTLSLWFPQLHSELVVGVVGSSAPLLAQLDFSGYLEYVNYDIERYDAANNRTFSCREQISTAIDTIQMLLQNNEGRKYLTDTFRIQPSLSSRAFVDPDTIMTFFQRLLAPIMEGAQYGGFNQTYSTDECCNIMTDPTSGLDAVERLALVQTKGSGEQPIMNVDYNELVKALRNAEWNSEFADARSWLYQTCTELGFFQTTNRGTNTFRSTIPTTIFFNQCKDVFDIDGWLLQDSVKAVNRIHKGLQYAVFSRVVITNGGRDPWLSLSMPDWDERIVVYEMKDAYHCRDLYPAKDDQDVKRAQEIIATNIKMWLRSDDVLTMNQNHSEVPMPPLTHLVHSEITNHPREKSDKKIFTEGSITQQFSSDNKNTFQQRFFALDKWSSSNGPNLLMLGGAAPASEYWLTEEKLPWLQWAQELGANVYLLEHRYFGKSKLDTTDLTFLQSSYAVEDAANFIRTYTLKANLSGPWIAYGGAYAGDLAARLRSKHPSLVLIAVSSSPLTYAHQIVDFYGYLYSVEKYLTFDDPFDECRCRLKEAFDGLQEQLQSADGRSNISRLFNLLPSWEGRHNVTEASAQHVFNRLIAVVAEVFENSNVNRYGGNIFNVSTMCTIMKSDGETGVMSELDALKNVATWRNVTIVSSDPAADNQRLRNMIDYIDGHDSTYSDDELATLLWHYMKCNEYGGFLTTDSVRGIFSSATVPVNPHIQVCEQVFHLDFNTVMKNVQPAFPGRIDIATYSNTITIKGNRDPWRLLSPLDVDESNGAKTFTIYDTTHCADMYPPNPATDSNALGVARATILAYIKERLPKPTTTAPSTTTLPTTKPSTTTVVPSSPTSIVASTTTNVTPTVSTVRSYTVADSLRKTTIDCSQPWVAARNPNECPNMEATTLSASGASVLLGVVCVTLRIF